jgi:purine-nucleoside phosphorylase
MTTPGTFAELVALARAKPPLAGVVLGSGLGPLVDRVNPLRSVPFAAVPGLEATSVVGHRGRLVLGDWAGQRVLVFDGRLHYYECGDWQRVAAPVHTARSLGARIWLTTNAAGGIHEALLPGHLMVLSRHLEWTRPGCWRPAADIDPGSPYSPKLRQRLHEAGKQRGIELHEGVYAAVTGPCYETPAEIRALRNCGADAVGMSTAREVQTAHDLGLECAAISLITNRAAGLSSGPINHDEVLATALVQADRLADLIETFLAGLEPLAANLPALAKNEVS